LAGVLGVPGVVFVAEVLGEAEVEADSLGDAEADSLGGGVQ
jgi:hypothetical protein